MSRYIDYFAYGSNLTHARLVERIGMCQVKARATLPGYRLAFHKRGTDGSAKCDAHHTGHALDLVRGVIYEITHQQKLVLDRYEGVGFGYDVHTVEASVGDAATVRSAPPEAVAVVTYLAQQEFVDPGTRPFSWYRDYVALGARSHGLPGEYVAAIEAVPAVRDPDAQRHHRNIRILSTSVGALIDGDSP